MRLGPTLAVLALAAPTLAAAQEAVYVRRTPPAWLGIGYEVQWLQTDGRCEARVLVENVVQGSPAERAGLRPGDAILALNGERSPAGHLARLAVSLSPGDSVRIRLHRGGATREVTAVAGRRPERPPTLVFPGRTGGFAATTAPVVRLVGDTVLAVNVATGGAWAGDRSVGYWLASDDGQAEYRRSSPWSRTDLDRRVAELLLCADTLQAAAPPRGPVRVDLREVQERADSLRVVIARRVLAREDEGARIATVRELTRQGEEAPFVRAGRAGEFEFLVEDYVVTGLRGVAGAELTALEPELAAYFRNVREGLLVLRVAPGTPAARAGLRPGDVIVAGAGRSLDAIAELRSVLARSQAAPLELRVVRRGRTLALTLRRD